MGMPFSSFRCLCRPRNWRSGLTARLGSGYSFPASTGEAGHWVGEPSELSAPRWAMPFDHLVKEGAGGPAAGSFVPSSAYCPLGAFFASGMGGGTDVSRACPPGVCPGAASAGSRGGQGLRCPSGRGGHGGEDAARGERPLSLGAEAGGREGTPELAPKPLVVGLSGGSSRRTFQAGQRKWRCEGQKQRGVTAGVGWGDCRCEREH